MRMPTILATGLSAALLISCEPIEDVPLVQPGTQTGKVVFVNQADRPVVSLAFNPCDRQIFGAPDFGPERLQSGQQIAPGARQEVTVSAGCYNLRALTGGGGFLALDNLEYFTRFGVPVNGTATVPILR